MIEAICTYGDGPVIMIVSKNHHYILSEPLKTEGWKFGYSTSGSLDLTLEEAMKLHNSLSIAIRNVMELESYKELEDREEET